MLKNISQIFVLFLFIATSLSAKIIHPGTVKKIQHQFSEQVREVKCDNEKIPFYQVGSQFYFYLAESYYSENKRRVCKVIFLSGKSQNIVAFKVKKLNYPKESLTVQDSKIDVVPTDLKRVLEEKDHLTKIYNSSSLTPLIAGEVIAPMDSIITSTYGRQRIYNKKKRSEHLGVDYRAKIGTPIKLGMRGKVVYAGDLFYTGGTIIMDHGLSIFSVYAHLSELKVKVGEILPSGTLIALSGATGRVSGPHLHYGVKINGHWINPYSLMDEIK